MTATERNEQAGRKAGENFEREAREEEREVEEAKGSDLKKGADRFDERSRSSDGKGAGEKQR